VKRGRKPKHWSERKVHDGIRHRLYRFGITTEQYYQILADQDNRCTICDVVFADGGRLHNSPVVDHDHETGRFRGIICHRCNVVLKYYHTVQYFRRVIDYLEVSS